MTLDVAKQPSPTGTFTGSRPGRRLAAAAGLAALSALACGGKAFAGGSDAGGSGNQSSSTTSGSGGSGNQSSSTASGSGGTGASSSTSSGGSTSGSTGSGGTGGGLSSSSSGGTGAGATGGTAGAGGVSGSGGALPELCLQPLDPGPCDGAFPSYGFDSELGSCEYFLYGGCEGNDNRFETREACLDACGPGDRTACTQSADCVINHGCCGYCGIESVGEFEAVNQAYADYNDLQCQLVDCAYCAPPADAEQFGARCNEGSCEVFDIRQSDLSECSSDEDCRLRAGTGCCEGCGDSSWVAISAGSERLVEALCGDGPVACPACAPAEPSGWVALCGSDGHCMASQQN